MKKALVILVTLGLVAAASAEVRLFFTASTVAGKVPGTTTNAPGLAVASVPTAWNVPSFANTADDDAGNPSTYANNQDYSSSVVASRLRVTTFATYSTAVPSINPKGIDGIAGNADDEFVYAWVQFYNETGAKLRSWMPGVVNTTNGNSTANVGATWYRCDNQGGTPAKLRWQGFATSPAFPEFHANPITLAGVTAEGILNQSALAEGEDADENGYPDTYTRTEQWNLYRGDDFVANGPTSQSNASRIALLGSFQPTDNGTYSIAQFAEVDLNGLVATPLAGSFIVTPEPASMLLLGLAGLMIRRR